MMATEFYRIFTKEDLYEFLFRLPIVLDKMNLLENWFGYEQLMKYKVKEMQYTFTIQDVFDHFGMEQMEVLFNYVSREEFLENANLGPNFARVMGLLNRFEVIPTAKSGKELRTLHKDKVAAGITEEVLKNATFFADDAIKLAPEELFTDRDRFLEREKEIKERAEAIAKIPKFDIAKIPDEIMKKCIDHLFDPEFVEEIRETNEQGFEKELEKYIYLAWLGANGYIRFEKGQALVHEGIEINPDDYKNNELGNDLYMIYEYSDMQGLEPLLKGLLH
jgi:hypothetical protein